MFEHPREAINTSKNTLLLRNLETLIFSLVDFGEFGLIALGSYRHYLYLSYIYVLTNFSKSKIVLVFSKINVFYDCCWATTGNNKEGMECSEEK